jgi:acyl-CoA hydrolase
VTQQSNDPARCAEAIVDRVGRDIRLAVPIGIGKPVLLVNALYKLAEADRSISLRIFTGLSLMRPRYRNSLEQRFVAPLLDRLFASYPDLLYAQALRAGALQPNVEVTEFFLQAGAWLGNAHVQQHYTSLNYARVGVHLERIGTNVMAQLVAPRPGGGEKVSLSSNTDVTLDLAPYVAKRRRDGKPVVFAGELNANLPYMPGEAEIPRDDFDMLLEPSAPDYDLFAPPKEPVSLADYAMALHAATLVKDGGTLQLGIGSFADALAHALILRHSRNAEFRALLARLGEPLPDAQLEPFATGLYGCTEMLVDAFLALKRAGILRRRVTDGSGRSVVLHAGFFVGNQAFYRELREMPDDERADICMTSVSFTNTLDGDEALKREQRRDARFINTAMTVTLLGAASSDQLEDGRVVSGTGGQHDLVSTAQALDGARSIIAVRGTRSHDRRTISNIVWRYANATVPRHLRDIVVTEYGIADLRGKSDRDCIAATLAVADSRFQPGLQREAQQPGKLEPSFALAGRAAENSPARIDAALGPARRPAAGVPARHRDDRDGTVAGRRPVRTQERWLRGACPHGLGWRAVCAIGERRGGAGTHVACGAVFPGRPGAEIPCARRAAAATPLMGRWRKAQGALERVHP